MNEQKNQILFITVIKTIRFIFVKGFIHYGNNTK